eukprot:TRINITY_DN2059_c0_g2_i1.p1 TRINITY_DN2059_c0_g2~~TRINITY_DN2059_c0_g2_i1.p1  ORF type:complete len:231 (-),score=84.28 TRINITY_DN2059_c0_g2_i1:404-1003(-)
MLRSLVGSEMCIRDRSTQSTGGLWSQMEPAQQDKRTIYVGGLEEHVDEPILTSAFVPFGDITSVQIPKEQTSDKHRGFGFVTFEFRQDAKEAMENMNNSELFGRVLRCNLARPQRAKAEGSGKAVWAEEFADEFFKDEFEKKDEKDGDIFDQAAMLPVVGEVTRDKRGNAKALFPDKEQKAVVLPDGQKAGSAVPLPTI